jgi:hypothetical protein
MSGIGLDQERIGPFCGVEMIRNKGEKRKRNMATCVKYIKLAKARRPAHTSACFCGTTLGICKFPKVLETCCTIVEFNLPSLSLLPANFFAPCDRARIVILHSLQILLSPSTYRSQLNAKPSGLAA